MNEWTDILNEISTSSSLLQLQAARIEMMKGRNVVAENMRGNHSHMMADIAAGPSTDTKGSLHGNQTVIQIRLWRGTTNEVPSLDRNTEEAESA